MTSSDQSASVSNLAFYQFFSIDDPDAWCAMLKQQALQYGVRGTMLVASEGVNAMVAAPNKDASDFIVWLRSLPEFEHTQIKISYSDTVPFQRLKVKKKKEIVTMRVDGVDAVCKTGKQLPPEQLRDWIRGEEPFLLIDCRNDYEYRLGTFVGAVDPATAQFNEFPKWVRDHKDELQRNRVVMFCTGGIRCEKATAWMLDLDLDIYQLQGGVLNYFLTIDDAEKDWHGDLFVFDERVALNTKSQPTDAILCPSCGLPIKESTGIVHQHRAA